MTGGHRLEITDYGSNQDVLCPATTLMKIAKEVPDPDDAELDYRDDNSIRVDSLSEVACKSVFDNARKDITTLLAPNGPVWRTHLEPCADRIDITTASALGFMTLLSRLSHNDAGHVPKTVSVANSNLSNLGSIAGFRAPAGDRFHVLYTFMGVKRVAQVSLAL